MHLTRNCILCEHSYIYVERFTSHVTGESVSPILRECHCWGWNYSNLSSDFISPQANRIYKNQDENAYKLFIWMNQFFILKCVVTLFTVYAYILPQGSRETPTEIHRQETYPSVKATNSNWKNWTCRERKKTHINGKNPDPTKHPSFSNVKKRERKVWRQKHLYRRKRSVGIGTLIWRKKMEGKAYTDGTKRRRISVARGLLIWTRCFGAFK